MHYNEILNRTSNVFLSSKRLRNDTLSTSRVRYEQFKNITMINRLAQIFLYNLKTKKQCEKKNFQSIISPHISKKMFGSDKKPLTQRGI